MNNGPRKLIINFVEMNRQLDLPVGLMPKLPKKLRCDNGPEMSSRAPRPIFALWFSRELTRSNWAVENQIPSEKNSEQKVAVESSGPSVYDVLLTRGGHVFVESFHPIHCDFLDSGDFALERFGASHGRV